MDLKWKKRLGRCALYAAVVLILLWTLAPFYWMFISSISNEKELLSVPTHWFPSQPTFERYQAMLLTGSILHRGVAVTGPAAAFKLALWNSTLVAGVTTLVSLLLGALSGYAFARLRFAMRGPLLIVTMAVQMLPPIATIIPLYILLRKLGMLNTRLALTLVYCSFTITYVVWVMNGFFRNIPRDLEEAARIDGCSRLGALFRVIVPVAVPGLVATGLLSFLTAWNEFLYALTLMNDPAGKTVPVLVAEFSTQYGVDYGMMMAGGVLASVIPALLALVFQRQLIRGLTSGAVKG